ncbi:hypothetical protein HYS31_01635 [Candidatus Woesearchaeota archaeon]|nr:hypothetical protein [Candidatus Woesearchaeota archaeon]
MALIKLISRTIMFAIIWTMLIGFANVATIHGNVYDLSLKKANNAKVEINTSPKQVMVAANGTYSFNVPQGNYKIKAQIIQKNAVTASVQENISIVQDGIYVIDLILFPDFEEGIGDPDIDINGNAAENNSRLLLILAASAISIIIVSLLFYSFYNKNRKNSPIIEPDGYIEEIIRIIKKEGGRATQKEIRKEIPLSEAKVSLMIAELEHKGIVEKIKKGRGNIIILKK